MRKIIKRKIQISTHKRELIDFINDEFYSHDKHNAFIEFTMKSLPSDNIIALFYFQKTKRYVETKAFVDGDKFTIEFDTSLINTDETVLGFIYFEKVAQSADVHRFSFGVKVSEIDKLHDIPIQEQSTKRVVAIEDIVTKAELDELFKRIEKNGATYNDTEIRSSISSIEERVHNLESKPDKDTVYDDSDVKNRLNVLETNASRYLTEHQPLTRIEERIQQVEARFNNLSNIYLSSHQSLEHLATNDALGKIEQRVQKLEAIDVTNFATKQELDALSNSQPSIENRLTALENKPTVDTTVFAKKTELYNDSALTERVSLLEAKAIANGAYDDKPLLDKIRAIEEQFRNASNLYLQSHQSSAHLVTRDELEDKHYLTSIPEEYAKKSDLTDLATNTKVESVENRVQVLENKSVVTHEELESAGYAKTTDLTNLAANSKVEAVESRVLALENKPAVVPQGYDDSALSGRVSALEAKQDKDTVYNDEEIKRRLTTLEGKTDNFITGVSVNKEGSNVTLTYNYVDGQTKNVSFTDSDTVNVAYDDSGLKQRITNLENRPQVEAYNDADIKQRLTVLEKNHVTKEELHDATELDETQFVSPEELEAKHYLTATQADSVYAKKSELPVPYNDSALASRVSDLESKQDNDTVYNDTEIKQRITNLENRPQVDLTDYAKKSEIPNTTNFATTDSVNNLLRAQGEQTVKISALEAKSAYEIHGTGMPNGRVTAPIGTTYVDMAVTNGALKWIKQTGSDNTGWKVIHGDTGWRNLKIVSQYGNSYVKIRRVNNNVMYHFGSVENGKFGMLGRNDVGVVALKGQEKHEIIIVDVDGIPQGFRTANSIMGDMFFLQGYIRGIYHVRGTSDRNFLSVRTSNTWSTTPYIYNLMININYCTDDDWPTELPTI